MQRLSLVVRALAITGLFAGYHATASAQGDPLFAVLVGGNEVNAQGQANQGDTDGFGTATVIIHPTADTTSETVCFGITVRAIDTPTMAHIHQAKAGLNGGVVVNLIAPTAGNPGTASGCTENVPNSVITALKNTPANFYVNIHTAARPGGALRGQLF